MGLKLGCKELHNRYFFGIMRTFQRIHFCRFTASDHEILIFAFSFIFFKKKITKQLFSKDRFNENLLGGLFVTAARKIFSKSFRKAPVTKFAQELFDRGYLNWLFFLQVFSLPKWRNQAISLCEITSNKLSF